MVVAYVRVSTTEQSEGRQMEALKELGIEKYFIEKVSGKNIARAEFQKMMDFLREGDTLYVTEWSRLSRSTSDLLHTIKILEQKGVKVVSLKENFDTSSAQGKLVLTIFAALAEFEREMILERQREGIALARQAGKYKGRREKELENFDEIYQTWKRKEITAKAAAKLLGVTSATFYNRVNRKEGKGRNGESGDDRKDGED